MKRRMYGGALIASVIAVLGFVVYQAIADGSAMHAFPARIGVTPKQAQVFRGDALRFSAAVVGAAQPYDVRWSVVGPGVIDADGLYLAPDTSAAANIVASAGSGVTDSATVRTVVPPAPRRPLALVSCYNDATIDTHDRAALQPLGALTLRGRTAGVAYDPERRLAFVASDEVVYAVQLESMRWRSSAPLPDARFSELVYLGHGLVAASDNDAPAGGAGIRVFRADAAGKPVLVSSAVADETPEGLAVADGGRTLYVTNINGDSLLRYAVRSNGTLKRTGRAITGARPFGVAVDPVHHLIFVADNDTATVSGARANPGLERFSERTLRRIGGVMRTGTPNSLPLGVVVDSAASRLFVVNEGDSNVVVYSIPSMRRIASLPVGLTPWLPSFDPVAHRIYVPNARGDSFDVYDTRTLRPVRRAVATCGYPTYVGLAR